MKVDYEKRKASGIMLPGVIWYLIGSVVAVVTYANNDNEIIILNAREPIQANDPYMRELIGARAIGERAKSYKDQIEGIIGKLERVFKDTNESKKFNGRTINEIAIVKA